MPPRNYGQSAIQHPPFPEKQVRRATRKNPPGTRPARLSGRISGRAVRRPVLPGKDFAEAGHKTGWFWRTFDEKSEKQHPLILFGKL